MRGSDRYVEPPLGYVTRKYFEPSLAILPLVGGLVANAVLLGGVVAPPLWALAYANLVTFGSAVAILVGYRNRFERRRFRIDGDSVALPSVVRVDESRLEWVAIKSVLWVRGTSGEIGILGWHRQALTEVEIKTRYGEGDVVLVWPIGAFGKRNLEALQRALSPAATHA